MTEEEKKRRIAELEAKRDKDLAAGQDANEVQTRFDREKAAVVAEYERDK